MQNFSYNKPVHEKMLTISNYWLSLYAFYGVRSCYHRAFYYKHLALLVKFGRNSKGFLQPLFFLTTSVSTRHFTLYSKNTLRCKTDFSPFQAKSLALMLFATSLQKIRHIKISQKLRTSISEKLLISRKIHNQHTIASAFQYLDTSSLSGSGHLDTTPFYDLFRLLIVNTFPNDVKTNQLGFIRHSGHSFSKKAARPATPIFQFLINF